MTIRDIPSTLVTPGPGSSGIRKEPDSHIHDFSLQYAMMSLGLQRSLDAMFGFQFTSRTLGLYDEVHQCDPLLFLRICYVLARVPSFAILQAWAAIPRRGFSTTLKSNDNASIVDVIVRAPRENYKTSWVLCLRDDKAKLEVPDWLYPPFVIPPPLPGHPDFTDAKTRDGGNDLNLQDTARWISSVGISQLVQSDQPPQFYSESSQFSQSTEFSSESSQFSQSTEFSSESSQFSQSTEFSSESSQFSQTTEFSSESSQFSQTTEFSSESSQLTELSQPFSESTLDRIPTLWDGSPMPAPRARIPHLDPRSLLSAQSSVASMAPSVDDPTPAGSSSTAGTRFQRSVTLVTMLASEEKSQTDACSHDGEATPRVLSADLDDDRDRTSASGINNHPADQNDGH